LQAAVRPQLDQKRFPRVTGRQVTVPNLVRTPLRHFPIVRAPDFLKVVDAFVQYKAEPRSLRAQKWRPGGSSSASLSSQCAATVRYQGGRLKGWLKIKNRKHPAMERVLDAL
jgi:hypothetical protein